MKLRAFINGNGISASHLARRAGMLPTTFINKINGRLNSSLTHDEKERILAALLEISKDITSFIEKNDT